MKSKILIYISIFATLAAGTAYAEKTATNITPGNKSATVESARTTTPAQAHKPGMKAERGIKNILFGWTDIPKSIVQVTNDSDNAVWGLTGGTLKGIGKAFPRTVSGIADVVSFPIGDYDKTPVSPDEWKTQIE